VYEARSYPDAKRILLEFGGAPVVVQRRENNLTGRGTRLVSDWRELSQAFAEWGEERLKVSQYIDGIPLTISGCVCPARTIVSAISKQFVGTPRLTCFWGAHCGNQLIKSAELGDQIAALCFDACKKVGDELRRRGFLGVFGLDLLQSRENEVFVIEINPRLQSVSSLVNVAEIEAGMLPLPGVHLLSFLLEKIPVTTSVAALAVPPLSQVVLYARRKGIISETPESGRYRLEEGGLTRAVSPPSLRHLSNKEALVWSFVKSGEYAQEDTRLCVLQTRFHLAGQGSQSVLTDTALKWIDALEALFKYRA
jgi:biotin carboxylase